MPLDVSVILEGKYLPVRKRYSRVMRNLGYAADFSPASIDRYHHEAKAGFQAQHVVAIDIRNLERCASHLALASLPKIYRDSLSRFDLRKVRERMVAIDLHSLMQRAEDDDPQVVLGLDNIEAEIASWPTDILARPRMYLRHRHIRLIRHDLVAADPRYDVETMTTPARLEPQLASFLRGRVDGLLKRRWKAYLVFLDSQTLDFSVSPLLFDAFRSWLIHRGWPEHDVVYHLEMIKVSIRIADRREASGLKIRWFYRVAETDLTDQMAAFLAEFETRARDGDPSATWVLPGRVRNVLIDFRKCCRAAKLEADVNELSAHAYRQSLSRRGTPRNRAAQAFQVLQHYHQGSHGGADWLQVDERARYYRAASKVSMPPTIRRKFDLYARQARLGRFSASEKRVRVTELLLGKLFRFCRAKNRPEDLSQETISLYFESLEDRLSPATLKAMRCRLRRFLRQFDPQNSWIFGGYYPTRRTFDQLVGQNHWNRIRGRVMIAREKGLSITAIRNLDPVLEYASTHEIVSPARILALSGSNRMKMLRMTRTLQIIDPESSLIYQIRAAAALICRKTQNYDSRTDRIVACFEKLLTKCPNPLRDRLAELTAPDLRGNREISLSAASALIGTARKLENVASEKKIPTFTAETYAATIVMFAASDLQAVSILGHLRGMLKISTLLMLPPETKQTVHRYNARFKSSARREVGRKVSSLSLHPVALEDIARVACKARQEAFDTKLTVASARFKMSAAAATAIWTALPLRISDMQKLILGISLIRRANAWHIVLTTSKTGVSVDRILPHQVTPHIDLLVMRGMGVATESQLRVAYTSQEGLPLFRNYKGVAVTGETFRRYLRSYVNVTPHVIRTLVRDKLAIHGAEGDEVSSHQLSHSSASSGVYYEIYSENIRATEADRAVLRGNLGFD